MNKILLLLAILIRNSCLEVKFLKKTEFFFNNCNSGPIKIIVERLKKECNTENFSLDSCEKSIDGESGESGE